MAKKSQRYADFQDVPSHVSAMAHPHVHPIIKAVRNPPGESARLHL
jgi:hypothetical protein